MVMEGPVLPTESDIERTRANNIEEKLIFILCLGELRMLSDTRISQELSLTMNFLFTREFYCL